MTWSDAIFTRAAGVSAVAVVGIAPSPESPEECFEELGDCPNSVASSSGDLPWDAVVIGAVFIGVLVFGLRAIKRQRDEGRRSKLPPIG